MASYKKEGKTWTARLSYYDANHKRKYVFKRGFKKQSDAKDFVIDFEANQLHRSQLEMSDISFGRYMDYWFKTYKKNNVSPSTENNYSFSIDQVKRYFKDDELKDIKKSDYQRFLNYLSQNYATATSEKIAGHCKRCVSYAIDDEIIVKDFTFGTHLARRRDKDHNIKNNYLDVKDMQSLKEYTLPKATIDNISAAMVITALLTGARYAEVCGLTWQDIDYNEKAISINKTWDWRSGTGFRPTKTKASDRVIPVPNELLHLFRQLKESQMASKIASTQHLIFISKLGKVPSSNAVNNFLRRAHKKIGIKQITFHGLRHTHASYLIYKHISIYMIAARLGHSDVGVTQRIYAHILSEQRQVESKKILSALGDL